MAFRYSAPQIKTNSPKNIAPLTRFIVPTMRKGDSSKNGGSVLHRQAQRGKLVVPLATATSRDSTKTSKLKYQRNMVAEVPLKKTRRPLVPPLSDPAAGKTTLTPRRTHDAPRQAEQHAPCQHQPSPQLGKLLHPLAQRQIPQNAAVRANTPAIVAPIAASMVSHPGRQRGGRCPANSGNQSVRRPGRSSSGRSARAPNVRHRPASRKDV